MRWTPARWLLLVAAAGATACAERHEKPGFRSHTVEVAAPSAHPLTLVLLAEPRDRTRTRASREEE